MGLVFCNAKNGNNVPNNTWICHHPGNCNDNECHNSTSNEEIQNISKSECGDLQHGKDFLALASYGTVIPTIRLLPKTSNTTESAAYWANYTDRWKDVDLGTGGGSSPGSSPDSINSSHASTDKTATTIGMAIGLGAGIPILLGIAAAVFFYLRHQRKEKANTTANDTIVPSHSTHPAPEYPDDKKGAVASDGFKAELGGTQPPISPGPSEMQDTSVKGSSYVSPLVSPATMHDGFKGEGISKYQGPYMRSHPHEMAG